MTGDAPAHRGVQVLMGAMLAICGAVLGFVYWQTDKRQSERDAWDVVAIGARCTEPGAEERTFDGKPVHCASMPSDGLLLWSSSPRDIPPLPEAWSLEALSVPPGQRVQVRVCMSQTDNTDRACQAAIEWSEREHGPSVPKA